MRVAEAPAPVGVVIPFYQRERGLLSRAVGSVLAQVGMNRAVIIFVVDDESPLPAADDLAGIEPAPPFSLNVCRTVNAGAGAARNVGIARALAAGCAHIAFLDSDDWWAPAHLAAAMAALDSEADFYFANSMHGSVPSFSYFTMMKTRGAGAGGTLHAAEALAMLLEECVPHTSQVVYTAARFPTLRFDERMRRSGEDHLFWLSVAQAGARFRYSNAIMGHRGHGISIYGEALNWDSPHYLARLLDAYHFRTLVAKRFRFDAAIAAANERHRQEAADEIAFAVVRRPALAVRHARAILWREGAALPLRLLRAAPRLPAIVRNVRARYR